MFMLWVAGVCLLLSALLIFGPPLLVFGPRGMARRLYQNADMRVLTIGAAVIITSLFFVAGSPIETGSGEYVSALNFYGLSNPV